MCLYIRPKVTKKYTCSKYSISGKEIPKKKLESTCKKKKKVKNQQQKHIAFINHLPSSVDLFIHTNVRMMMTPQFFNLVPNRIVEVKAFTCR